MVKKESYLNIIQIYSLTKLKKNIHKAKGKTFLYVDFHLIDSIGIPILCAINKNHQSNIIYDCSQSISYAMYIKKFNAQYIIYNYELPLTKDIFLNIKEVIQYLLKK